MCEDYNELIEYRVSMDDILSVYGIEKNRKGFICCPFHGEKTASCIVHEKTYHCFGCGSHGNAITFVMNYEGVDFITACKKIDGYFSLGIFKNEYDESAKKEIERIAREKKEKKGMVEFQTDMRKRAFDNYAICEQYIKNHEPLFGTDTLSKNFVKALKFKEYWWSIVEDCDIKLFKLREERK